MAAINTKENPPPSNMSTRNAPYSASAHTGFLLYRKYHDGWIPRGVYAGHEAVSDPVSSDHALHHGYRLRSSCA